MNFPFIRRPIPLNPCCSKRNDLCMRLFTQSEVSDQIWICLQLFEDDSEFQWTFWLRAVVALFSQLSCHVWMVPKGGWCGEKGLGCWEAPLATVSSV